MPELEAPRALPEMLHNGEAPEGPPVALPDSAREGISLLPVGLSSPAPELWCSQPLPETASRQGLWAAFLLGHGELGRWEGMVRP